MTSSLQNGINAAKAGRTQEALDFLKDAIIDEPQNADVWVWIAAIIDDLDKQDIFLKKALDIDPNNIPAQRGIAYLNKRKQQQASNQNDHLSDHTRPISPFPAPSKKEKKKKNRRKPSKPKKEKQTKQRSKGQKTKAKQEANINQSKLSLFEISLIGIVVVVFSFIGLLTASSLFDFDLPLDFLNNTQPRLNTEPPYPGVFLYDNETHCDIQQHESIPNKDLGIPTSFDTDPVIVFWRSDTSPDEIKLIYQTGDFIPLETFQGKGGADLFQSTRSLETGVYCLQGQPQSQTNTNPVYWCLKIASPPEN